MKGTKRDFDALLRACLTALVQGEVDVYVTFPSTWRFTHSFPKGICIERRPDGRNVHKVKAKRLSMWLHQHGHTMATIAGLRAQKLAFTAFEKEIENMVKNSH